MSDVIAPMDSSSQHARLTQKLRVVATTIGLFCGPQCVSHTRQPSVIASVVQPRNLAATEAQSELARLHLMLQRFDNLRPADTSRTQAAVQIADLLATLAARRRREAIEVDPQVRTVRWTTDSERSTGDSAEIEGPAPTRQRDLLQISTLNAAAQRLIAEADQLCERALRYYQIALDEPRTQAAALDIAMYSYAALMDEFGIDPRRAYFELIRRFPASPYVANAYLWFGDSFFERGEMQQARQCYERVLSVGGPLVHYARYKLAWCAINQNEWQRAAALLRELLLDRSRSSEDNIAPRPGVSSADSLGHRARIRAEALADLAFVFAQEPALVRPEQAVEQLAALGTADVVAQARALERVCEVAYDSARWQFAADVCALVASRMRVLQGVAHTADAPSLDSRCCRAIRHAVDAAQTGALPVAVQRQLATQQAEQGCGP